MKLMTELALWFIAGLASGIFAYLVILMVFVV